jgi:hypothetical protein
MRFRAEHESREPPAAIDGVQRHRRHTRPLVFTAITVAFALLPSVAVAGLVFPTVLEQLRAAAAHAADVDPGHGSEEAHAARR